MPFLVPEWQRKMAHILQLGPNVWVAGLLELGVIFRADLFWISVNSLIQPASTKHSSYLVQCLVLESWSHLPRSLLSGQEADDVRRDKLLYCVGKGTHLVLSFSSRRWEKTTSVNMVTLTVTAKIQFNLLISILPGWLLPFSRGPSYFPSGPKCPLKPRPLPSNQWDQMGMWAESKLSTCTLWLCNQLLNGLTWLYCESEETTVLFLLEWREARSLFDLF